MASPKGKSARGGWGAESAHTYWKTFNVRTSGGQQGATRGASRSSAASNGLQITHGCKSRRLPCAFSPSLVATAPFEPLGRHPASCAA
jgi:hypothetical protein